MIGRITIKRALKQTVGWAAILTEPFLGTSARTSAAIFSYHRIADLKSVDPRADDWNVPPSQFERQAAALARFAECVPLLDLPDRLARATPSGKPLVCLTFDDGYANFYTQALPILQRYQLPAIVFVVTGVIGRTDPMPFDSWSQRNCGRVSTEAWRPMSWAELEVCVGSGLVHVGAHSHQHLKGYACTEAQMIEEAEHSRAILRSRLGSTQGDAYSYPYGTTRLGFVPAEYVCAVKSAGYQLAVTTDLGLAKPESDPYQLPRLEAHAVDRPEMIRAKANGALAPYYFTDRLRKKKRAL